MAKLKWTTTLYRLGLPPPTGGGFYAPPGANPDADISGWVALLEGGGPYDGDPLAEDFVDEVTTHHSSYYIPGSVAPAPMLISNGWNERNFLVDEGVRLQPGGGEVPRYTDHAVQFDSGHARGQGKVATWRSSKPAGSPGSTTTSGGSAPSWRCRRRGGRDDHLPKRDSLGGTLPRRQLGRARTGRDSLSQHAEEDDRRDRHPVR